MTTFSWLCDQCHHLEEYQTKGKATANLLSHKCEENTNEDL